MKFDRTVYNSKEPEISMKAIIIHGSYGSPEENWFPWLKFELEKKGIEVFIPKFPTPEGQSLQNWLRDFEQYKKHLGSDTILIGHSLGVPFILKVLELGGKAKSAFLVAGFTGKLRDKRFLRINRSFVESEFNWKKIRESCQTFNVFHSDNDPYVPLENGAELAEKLGTEPIIVKGAGHFNEKAGYKKFPQLLNEILKS